MPFGTPIRMAHNGSVKRSIFIIIYLLSTLGYVVTSPCLYSCFEVFKSCVLWKEQISAIQIGAIRFGA